MRIFEIVTLDDVLKASQYIKILKNLKVKSKTDIDVARIKNKVLKSWKTGMKSRKHYNKLLNQLNINLHDLIK
jgi:hypothetical protein